MVLLLIDRRKSAMHAVTVSNALFVQSLIPSICSRYASDESGLIVTQLASPLRPPLCFTLSCSESSATT